MNVAELIAALSDLDPEATVVRVDDDGELLTPVKVEHGVSRGRSLVFIDDAEVPE